MFLLLACVNHKESGSPDSLPLESQDSSTDSIERLENPWDAEGFWTDPGPLEELIFSTQDPPAPDWEVRMATSNDLISWTADDRLIARGFSSLHLLVVEGQGVVVGGVVDRRHLEGIGMSLPADAIYALVSSDLQNWGSHRWEIAGVSHTQVIDPGLYWGRSGELEAAWFGTSFDGDPAMQSGPHPIMGAVWDGVGFAQLEVPLYEAEGLADPSVCTMDGKTYLFATESAQRVVSAESEDGRSYGAGTIGWGGPTVPFCWEEEEKIKVIAQVSGGAQPPMMWEVAPGGVTEDLGTLWGGSPFPPEFGNMCTSPVVGKLGETWVMLCAMSMPG